jgi:hypothetical protein
MPRIPTHGVEVLRLDHIRREDARRVAGVDAGLFDMLLNAGDDAVLAVGEGIDIDLEGVFKKAIDQDRLLR